MASHCHHHHRHCCATPPAAASSCYCCSCGCPCSPPQPPPATAAADPLILQAIAAQLLQSPPPPIYSNQSLHYLYPNPSPPPDPDPRLRQWHKKQTSQHPHRENHAQHQGHTDLVESLLQRISALESSIPQTRPCTGPDSDAAQAAVPRPYASDRPGRDPVPRSAAPRRPVSSVRDAAARTIQAQFRLYLIRRSQTLRDLKQLAIIRSEVAALKTSLRRDSRHPHLSDLKAVQSRRAIDLLEKLDSIQSSDRMIKEGKRSIRLELIAITELTDGVINRLTPDGFEEQQDQPQHFPKAAATRRVSFADSSNEGDSRASEDDELYVEGEEEEDDDMETNDVRKKDFVRNGGKPGLHAPLPVKMESRRNESGDGN